jgi:hypothetical protein
MRALSVPELLRIWESGLAQGPVERGLLLLGAAHPDMPRESLALLTIGQRDAGLLTLREWTFGSRVDSVVVCPECGQRLELTFEISDVRVTACETVAEVAVTVAGYDLRLRPPNSLDVAAIAAEPILEVKRRMLFERCVVAISEAGYAATAAALPDDAVEVAARRLADTDPQADVQLNVACPCGKRWHSAFDIVSFFWAEIEAWACRILREVHVLASAYGWREADILALSPARRQFYLAMVGA